MTGLRVRQVRELLGWSQSELAERTGVSQGLISQIESGDDPSNDVLSAISLATGFPVAWFFRTPREGLPEGTIRYRKTSRASKRDDRRAIRRLELAHEIVDELAAARRTPPVSIPYLGAPRSVDDIEGYAADVRDAMNLSRRGPVQNLIRAAERAGAIVIGLPVDTGASGDQVSNHHGISAWPSIDDRPIIGFSTHDPGDRQRHTVAHEIGHLVMHRGVNDKDRDYEGEASTFAGAFLMPHRDALHAFSRGVTLAMLTRLKKSWGISIAALIVRAHQVGAIDRDRQTSLFKQLSARGWRKTEPVCVHREEPALVARLLDAHFGKDRDWMDVGRALDLPPHVVRELSQVAVRDVSEAPLIDLTERRRQRTSSPMT